MWILGLKGLTLPVAHLHHITSISAQSTTFKEAHKHFHLSIHNMNFLSLNGLVISFLYNLELPAKYATQSGIKFFSYNQNNRPFALRGHVTSFL